MFAGCHWVAVYMHIAYSYVDFNQTIFNVTFLCRSNTQNTAVASTCTNYNCFKTTFYGLLSEHKSIISGAFRSWCFFIIICEYDLSGVCVCGWLGELGGRIMMLLLIYNEIGFWCDAAVIADGATSWYIYIAGRMDK